MGYYEDPKEYVIYYYDRVEDVNKELTFNEIKEILNLYIVIGKEGKTVYVPLHRIREVRKKGKIVWKR